METVSTRQRIRDYILNPFGDYDPLDLAVGDISIRITRDQEYVYFRVPSGNRVVIEQLLDLNFRDVALEDSRALPALFFDGGDEKEDQYVIRRPVLLFHLLDA